MNKFVVIFFTVLLLQSICFGSTCESIFKTFEITVYHASPLHGLKEIEPKVSTHGNSWVYGTDKIGIVASYLGRWSDLDFNQSIDDTGTPVLVERYAGALTKIFSAQSGSIYTLPSDTFFSGKTSFSGEVVSTEKVTILTEDIIEDAFAYLKKLEKEGLVKLYFYPDRPSFVPKDDSDLIRKAVKWIRRYPNGNNYARFVTAHPNLKSQLDLALQIP